MNSDRRYFCGVCDVQLRSALRVVYNLQSNEKIALQFDGESMPDASMLDVFEIQDDDLIDVKVGISSTLICCIVVMAALCT